jgi:hypothetical protein
MTTPEDLINETKAVLERDGWCQNRPHGNDGTHCVMGAMSIAMHNLMPAPKYRASSAAEWRDCTDRANHREQVYREAEMAVANRIKKDYFDSFSHVPHWNDDPGRSVEDVMLVLKRAVHG